MAEEPTVDGGTDVPAGRGPDRRSVLAGLAAGAAWVAPQVVSLDAAAAATCFPPAFVLAQQGRADGITNGAVTRTGPVTGLPTSGVDLVHLAFAVVDHIPGLPASTAVAPAGWTLLGTYDSDVATAAATPPLPISVLGSTAVWSNRVVVWLRSGALQSSYSFDLTFSGNATFNPQGRVVVAAFGGARTVSFAGGQIAMQGSGLVDPTAPPASAPSTYPAVATTRPSNLVVGFTGAGNVSIVNTLTPPAGYTLAAVTTFADGNGYPPIWLTLRNVSGPGTVPSAAGTVAPGAPNVGGQLVLGC